MRRQPHDLLARPPVVRAVRCGGTVRPGAGGKVDGSSARPDGRTPCRDKSDNATPFMSFRLKGQFMRATAARKCRLQPTAQAEAPKPAPKPAFSPAKREAARSGQPDRIQVIALPRCPRCGAHDAVTRSSRHVGAACRRSYMVCRTCSHRYTVIFSSGVV